MPFLRRVHHVSSVISQEYHTVPPVKQRRIWPLIIATTCLVVVPTVGHAVRPEIARWYLAAADDQLLDYLWYLRKAATASSPMAKAEKQELMMRALRRVEVALESSVGWGGKTAQYFEIRSNLNAARSDFVARIRDLEAAVDKADGRQKYTLLSKLAGIEYSRQSPRAINLSEAALRLAQNLPENAFNSQLRSSALNELAYFRAVKGVELDQALEDVEEAIRIHEASISKTTTVSWFAEPSGPPPIDFAMNQFRDTRGYILLRLGRQKDARAEFDLIWETFDDWFNGQLNAEKASRIDAKKTRIDIRHVVDRSRSTNHSAAVIMYHRTMVLNDDADKKELVSLIMRILALGFKPDASLF
jgi:tetratricopeptide (TPR) repeat protein